MKNFALKTNSLRILAFFLICSIGFTTGCKKEANPPVNYVVLKHDGENLSAPSLPANTYEAATRFTAAEQAAVLGKKLVEVEFYIDELPSTCEVLIYASNGGSEPVTLKYTANVRDGLNAGAWNKHVLNVPYTITNEDLWIAVRFSHATAKRTIGCDPGPAITNGDWLFDAADSQWLPLSTRSAISINWNIRGNVDPS